MIKKTKITAVIKNDLCIACGACIESCPNKNIKSNYSLYNGAPEVKIINQNDCINCDIECEKSCPSVNINFNELSQINSQKVEVKRDNWIRSVYLASSTKESNNGISSSGGIIRAAIKHQLKQGIPVVCLSKNDNGTPTASLLENISDINNVPGSIYHSVNFTDAISKIRESKIPVTLVAIPCQVEGIMKYIKNFEPSLERKINLIIGIICGWMYSDHSLKSFSEKYNITSDNIYASEYRGEDRVGKLKIRISPNETKLFSRSEFKTVTEFKKYRSSFSTDYNRMRCRVCENHLNLLADIVAGDAWLSRKTKSKMSIIGCRTKKGEEFFDSLVSKEDIKYENSSFDDLIESQSHNLVYGTKARMMKFFLPDNLMLNSFKEKINTKTTLFFWLSMCFEFFRRSLIRKKKYKLYQYIHIVINLKIYLINIMSLIWRKFKKCQSS